MQPLAHLYYNLFWHVGNQALPYISGDVYGVSCTASYMLHAFPVPFKHHGRGRWLCRPFLTWTWRYSRGCNTGVNHT